jgi:diacylglycerol kinase (ATP)
MKPFGVRAAVDGRIIEREDCVAAMIANVGGVLGDLIELGPGISYDDGLLDLVLLSARGVADAAVLGGRILLKSYPEDRRMAFARGRRIALETFPPRLAQADGELLGDTPIVATVEPLAAPLLVPRRDD